MPFVDNLSLLLNKARARDNGPFAKYARDPFHD